VLAGTALIAAVFLPNVEFIFGLAGSTASVLIAYILPAAIFLVVSRPPKQPTGTLISVGSPTLMSAQSAEVSSPREGGMQQLNPWGVKGPRRKAWTLLVFGMVVAVVCTRATLTAVQQEAEVVLLAQELVASEAAVSLVFPKIEFQDDLSLEHLFKQTPKFCYIDRIMAQSKSSLLWGSIGSYTNHPQRSICTMKCIL